MRSRQQIFSPLLLDVRRDGLVVVADEAMRSLQAGVPSSLQAGGRQVMCRRGSGAKVTLCLIHPHRNHLFNAPSLFWLRRSQMEEPSSRRFSHMMQCLIPITPTWRTTAGVRTWCTNQQSGEPQSPSFSHVPVMHRSLPPAACPAHFRSAPRNFVISHLLLVSPGQAGVTRRGGSLHYYMRTGGAGEV